MFVRNLCRLQQFQRLNALPELNQQCHDTTLTVSHYYVILITTYTNAYYSLLGLFHIGVSTQCEYSRKKSEVYFYHGLFTLMRVLASLARVLVDIRSENALLAGLRE